MNQFIGKFYSHYYLSILVITVVITIFVIVVTGKIAQMIAQREGGIKNEWEMFRQSLFAGVAVSLIILRSDYFLRKLGLAVINPLLVSIVIVIPIA